MRAPILAAAALVAFLLPGPAAAQHWAISDPGQGPLALDPGEAGAHELSGLAWAGGDRWAAVSDADAHRLFWLRVAIDPATGRIADAAVAGSLLLVGSRDVEGVVVAPDGSSVTVSDEVGPAVREYALPAGQLVRAAPLPPVFATVRGNLGFEALTRDAAGHLWTANEEALTADGPTSMPDRGTTVRLLRLDRELRPTGQWAYVTDPVAGAKVLSDRGTGLSDLAALPDGRLLALERSLGSEGLRIRLYEVDLTGATEVSAVLPLAGADVRPVDKRLLWERNARRDNFEGLAVGPPLAGGGHSLLLVSDDGHLLSQSLYPLVLRPRDASTPPRP